MGFLQKDEKLEASMELSVISNARDLHIYVPMYKLPPKLVIIKKEKIKRAI